MANLLIRDPFLAAPFRLMDELMRTAGNGGNRVTERMAVVEEAVRELAAAVETRLAAKDPRSD